MVISDRLIVHAPVRFDVVVIWPYSELTGNTLYDTEGLRVIGNDKDNNTISMGHVIRGNTVIDKIDPPEARIIYYIICI